MDIEKLVKSAPKFLGIRDQFQMQHLDSQEATHTSVCVILYIYMYIYI